MSRIRIRPPSPGRMNKTEQAYAGHLALLQRAGDIAEYRFEALKLRLADKTFYTPDFVVVRDEMIELHEVKGFWEDDARVKVKVAAAQYPWFRFIAVQRKRQQWVTEEF